MDGPLETGAHVLQAEWHLDIVMYPRRGGECCLFFIFFTHANLMVPRVGIEEAKKLTSRCRVDQLINSRQREKVLWTSLVEAGEVYTHPPFTVCLPYHHRVCQPFWVQDSFDEHGLQEFGGFLLD